MSWTELSDQERAALLKRAKRRGLREEDLSASEDLIVKGRGVALDKGTRTLKPKLSKPRSLRELIAAVGPPEEARRRAAHSELRLHREHLRRLSLDIRPLRGRSLPHAVRRRDKSMAAFANMAARMVVNGTLQERELEKWDLQENVTELVKKIDLRQWLLPNVVVEAGSTLTFSGSGVHSLVAYRLIVEPGARILINEAAVSIDCVHLVVQ